MRSLTRAGALLKPLHFLSKSDSQLRLLSSYTAQVPPRLAAGMENYFSQLQKFGKVTMPPDRQALSKIGKEILKKLRDDEQTRNFIELLKNVRSDESASALFLTGMPKGNAASIYFANLVAGFLGYNPHFFDSRVMSQGSVPAFYAHQDFALKRGYDRLEPWEEKDSLNAELVSLLGREVDPQSKIQTYVIEVEDLRKRLSPRDVEILSLPIFCSEVQRRRMFEDDLKPEDAHFAVLSFDRSGSPRIVFNDQELIEPSYEMAQKFAVAQEDAREAIRAVNTVASNMVKEGQVDQFKILNDQLLMLFNSRILHGRSAGELSDQNSKRVLLLLGHGKAEKSLLEEVSLPSQKQGILAKLGGAIGIRGFSSLTKARSTTAYNFSDIEINKIRGALEYGLGMPSIYDSYSIVLAQAVFLEKIFEAKKSSIADSEVIAPECFLHYNLCNRQQNDFRMERFFSRLREGIDDASSNKIFLANALVIDEIEMPNPNKEQGLPTTITGSHAVFFCALLNRKTREMEICLIDSSAQKGDVYWGEAKEALREEFRKNFGAEFRLSFVANEKKMSPEDLKNVCLHLVDCNLHDALNCLAAGTSLGKQIALQNEGKTGLIGLITKENLQEQLAQKNLILQRIVSSQDGQRGSSFRT